MGTTQTTPEPYIPTPWSISPHEYCFGSQVKVWGDTQDSFYAMVGGSHKHDNARLITSAVNSYAKHCGPNAIQCAEDDLLGQALEALRTAQRVIADWRDGECSDGYVEQMKYDVLDSILARLPQQ